MYFRNKDYGKLEKPTWIKMSEEELKKIAILRLSKKWITPVRHYFKRSICNSHSKSIWEKITSILKRIKY